MLFNSNELADELTQTTKAIKRNLVIILTEKLRTQFRLENSTKKKKKVCFQTAKTPENLCVTRRTRSYLRRNVLLTNIH